MIETEKSHLMEKLWSFAFDLSVVHSGIREALKNGNWGELLYYLERYEKQWISMREQLPFLEDTILKLTSLEKLKLKKEDRKRS